MTLDGRIQCRECELFYSCPSNTRVFMNYCGGMTKLLKDQITMARVDCRVRRRRLKYHGVPRIVRGINDAIIIPDDVDILKEPAHAL